MQASIRVLLADDHPLVLKGLADYLAESQNVEVVGVFSNGSDALQGILDLAPQVAVLDISMPGKSGLEVLASVAEADLPVRVLFLCGAPAARDVTQALADGAYGFLSKDSDPAALLRAISEAAEGQRTFPYEMFERFQETEGQRPIPLDKLLSRREWKVMNFAAQGLSNKEIARRMGIAEGTAKLHLHHVFRKVGVKSRTALATLSMRFGDDPSDHSQE
jgi:two-component system, NarL family, nitrate/nitrite response regulator NarL